jgi:hypothetical protein
MKEYEPSILVDGSHSQLPLFKEGSICSLLQAAAERKILSRN